jgi:hypothetical protein
MKVLAGLRKLVEESEYRSKYCNEKAIKVTLSFYDELTIINYNLKFIDFNGNYFDILNYDITLEDLIDLYNKIK